MRRARSRPIAITFPDIVCDALAEKETQLQEAEGAMMGIAHQRFRARRHSLSGLPRRSA